MPSRHLYHHHYLKTLPEPDLAQLAERCRAWGMHPAEFARHISHWLENFDHEDDWPLAVKLINALEYYSEAGFHQLLSKRQMAVTRHLHQKGLSPERIWFAVPDDLADSATRHAHPLSKVWRLANEHFVSFAQLKTMSGLGAQDTLILFNDTYGSGKQFMREVWPSVMPMVAQLGAVLIVGTAIAREALDLFKREAVGAYVVPNYAVVTVKHLPGFTSAEVTRLQELGQLVYPKHALGFGGCGLLLAYHFQCPNNSLPLIWADGQNNAVAGQHTFPWTALFPYLAKTRGAAPAPLPASVPVQRSLPAPAAVLAPVTTPVAPLPANIITSAAPASEEPGKPAWASKYGKDEYGWWAELVLRGVTQRMRYILPGRFLMGWPYSEAESLPIAEPQHWVRISSGFWLADTSCTQALWQALMGENPSHFKESGLDAPVEMVSWIDAQALLQKLNTMLPDCLATLPTEAEWEYACRAGTTAPFFFGETISTEQVNYNGNYPRINGPESKFRGKTVPVKSLPANAWGLYQMHGNVWEWCADELRTYTKDEVLDPGLAGVLATQCDEQPSEFARVLRGGGWFDDALLARSAYRYHLAPDGQVSITGFRFALRAQCASK